MHETQGPDVGSFHPGSNYLIPGKRWSLSLFHQYIIHLRTNPSTLAWAGYKSAGLHRVMNQGSPFPLLPLLLGSEHRATGDILSPYLFFPFHAQQHRPQEGCKERLCFPSHPSRKASSPWQCQGAAHPLHHSCWSPALRHKRSLGHQLRAPWSKHHQELLTFGESFWPHHPHLLSILLDNNSRHLSRGGQSTATINTYPKITEILDYTTSNSAVLLTTLQTKLKKHIPLQGYSKAVTG